MVVDQLEAHLLGDIYWDYHEDLEQAAYFEYLSRPIPRAAAGIIRGITTIYNRYTDSDSGPTNPGVTIGIMGNMLVIPQVIIFFAMIDVFSYNSYQTHFLPLWLNALIVLLAGGLILGIFFLRAILRAWRANKE